MKLFFIVIILVVVAIPAPHEVHPILHLGDVLFACLCGYFLGKDYYR